MSIDLEAIKARAEAAGGAWNAATAPNDPTIETKRDYVLSAFHPDQADEPLWVVWANNIDNLPDADYVVVAVTGDGPRSKTHAEFIAHARTDVPALIAEVERQAAALRESQAAAWDEGKRAGIEQMRPTNPYRAALASEDPA